MYFNFDSHCLTGIFQEVGIIQMLIVNIVLVLEGRAFREIHTFEPTALSPRVSIVLPSVKASSEIAIVTVY